MVLLYRGCELTFQKLKNSQSKNDIIIKVIYRILMACSSQGALIKSR